MQRGACLYTACQEWAVARGQICLPSLLCGDVPKVQGWSVQASRGRKDTQNMGCPLRAVPYLFLIVMCVGQKWCARINFCSLSLYCIAVVRPTPISFFLSKVVFGEVPMLPAKTAEGTLGTLN